MHFDSETVYVLLMCLKTKRWFKILKVLNLRLLSRRSETESTFSDPSNQRTFLKQSLRVKCANQYLANEWH